MDKLLVPYVKTPASKINSSPQGSAEDRLADNYLPLRSSDSSRVKGRLLATLPASSAQRNINREAVGSQTAQLSVAFSPHQRSSRSGSNNHSKVTPCDQLVDKIEIAELGLKRTPVPLKRFPDARMITHVNFVHQTRMISLGELTADAGGRYGPRRQDRYEILFLGSGSLSLSLDGAVSKIRAGEVVLLKPGHEEQMRFSHACSSTQGWISLERELIPAAMISRLATAPSAIKGTDEMRALFEVALKLPRQATPMSTLMLEHIGLALLVSFIRQAEEESSVSSLLPTAVVKSLEYMESHLADQMSLHDVAAAACVTPHHLIKLFRKHLQLTPVKFLWHLRLQRGIELLRSTALDIGEIAYRIGYQSPFHFSRSFKAAHGASPRAFREMICRAEPK